MNLSETRGEMRAVLKDHLEVVPLTVHTITELSKRTRKSYDELLDILVEDMVKKESTHIIVFRKPKLN